MVAELNMEAGAADTSCSYYMFYFCVIALLGFTLTHFLPGTQEGGAYDWSPGRARLHILDLSLGVKSVSIYL